MGQQRIERQPFLFWILGLTYAALAAFALIIAFLWRTPLASSLMALFFTPFFPSTVPDPATLRFCGFVFGVLGAIMLSWVALMSFLAFGPLRRGEAWAAKALIVAALAWFLIDESFSLFYRVYANALGNVLILAFLTIPVFLLLRLKAPSAVDSDS